MDINYSKYKVLIAENVPINALLLKVILEQEKFQVLTARNEAEVFHSLSTASVDLIILDVMKTDKMCYRIMKKLKSETKFSHIPVIFITAFNAPAEIGKGFEMGGNDYITKPFNKEEVIAKVKQQVSFLDAKRSVAEKTEELNMVIEARNKLYAVVAHDLRSPISTLKMVLNALSMTARKNNVDAEFTEMLDSGNEISEQVFCLLDNLLKWVKAQSGILEPIFQPYNLNEIITGISEVATPSAKLKKLKLELNLESAVEAKIDTDMMKSIIRNLIFNAIKFSHPESTIRINLKKCHHNAIVEVHDKGCGISLENQTKLLSNFSSFSTCGTSREEGSGLGLMLSNHFVELHKGKFYFNSEIGKGSCFGFSIPLQS